MTHRYPAVLFLVALTAGLGAFAGDWPQFRGPAARGVQDGAALPAVWNVELDEGVRWRTRIPGLGHSSPVVAGGRVFLTTAISGSGRADLKVGLYGDIAPVDDETAHKFQVVAVDVNDGAILWIRTAHIGVPAVKRHTKAAHANASVATDGTHVIAMFGSEGLYAYDMDGQLLWSRQFGILDAGFFSVPDAQWGYGSSPTIHDGKVLVLADVQKGSFLAALDVRTGEELWRTSRDDVPTWGSPTVHVAAGRRQVLVNGFKHIGGYDLDSGRALWRMSGLGDIPTPTPYVAHDLAFFTSGHGGGMPVYAVRLTAEGDITLAEGRTSNEHVAWSDPRGGSYMPTSLVYGDEIYILRDNGILRCRDARTGTLHYEERIGGGGYGYTASLVAGDGKVYLPAETGDVHVVKAGTAFELLGTNPLGETLMASPAIADGMLLFRSRDHLTAIATPSPVVETGR